MCGIFAYLSLHLNNESLDEVIECANKIQHRGPDTTNKMRVEQNLLFVFHRLCINDLTVAGNQPLVLDNRYFVMCNGEIYNHKILEELHGFTMKSHSDCEVILHLFKKGGIDLVVSELKGYYGFTIWDNVEKQLYVSRDALGVRQLYYGYGNCNYCICSELKGIPEYMNIIAFPTDKIMKFTILENSITQQILEKRKNQICYYQEPLLLNETTIEQQKELIYNSLVNACERRFMTERPYGALLSGGLDSSLIAGIIRRLKPTSELHTFTIGLEDSPDILASRKVAKHINSIHHEIIITEEQLLNNVDRTIEITETWDTTTIRASNPMILLCEYIKKHTDIKVIFSGEGADEAGGGYRYFHQAPTIKDFHTECNSLLSNLLYYDCLRCDKSTAAFGLEVRAPFLDDDFIKEYMSVPTEWKMPKDGMEKWLIRSAFDNGLLPDDILWRSKEAFSDGVSKAENSWHKIIQTYVNSIVTDEEFETNKNYYSNPPLLKESYYYRKIFNSIYPGKDNVIPGYWMPKWSSTSDPSAREINN